MTASTPNDPTNPSPATSRSTGDLSTTRFARTTGAILIATSALAVLFMLMHPTSHAHSMGEFAAEAARGIPGNGPVHGILVALAAIIGSAFLGFAEVIAPRNAAARLGALLYLVGTLAGIGAGLINGFIVPAFAGAYADRPNVVETASQTAVPLDVQVGPALRLCSVTNATLARVDVIGLSVAAILWGAVLVTRRGVPRLLGVVGLAAGAAPLILLSLGHLPMSVHGFGLFVMVQSVWGVSAGAFLMRH